MKLGPIPEILLNASLAATTLNHTLSTRQAFQNEVFLDVTNAGVKVNSIEVFVSLLSSNSCRFC